MINAFLILFVFTLPLSVMALGIGAIYSIFLFFTDYPIGWAFGVLLFCIFYMVSGYRMMQLFTNNLIGLNRKVAICIPFIIDVIFIIFLIKTSFVYGTSAWWILLLPLTLIPQMLIQGTFEFILEYVNPNGE